MFTVRILQNQDQREIGSAPMELLMKVAIVSFDAATCGRSRHVVPLQTHPQLSDSGAFTLQSEPSRRSAYELLSCNLLALFAIPRDLQEAVHHRIRLIKLATLRSESAHPRVRGPPATRAIQARPLWRPQPSQRDKHKKVFVSFLPRPCVTEINSSGGHFAARSGVSGIVRPPPLVLSCRDVRSAIVLGAVGWPS